MRNVRRERVFRGCDLCQDRGTLRGELVNDLTADATSGLLYWNATNRAGRLVASGVYLVDIEAAGKRDIRKLAVIR